MMGEFARVVVLDFGGRTWGVGNWLEIDWGMYLDRRDSERGVQYRGTFFCMESRGERE